MLASLVLVVMLGTAAIAAADSVDTFFGSTYGKDAKGILYLDPNRQIEKNVSFSFEQSVQGNGYYMTYKYAKMGNSEFKDYAHGSGSLDNSAILTSYNAIKKTHLWNADWNDYNVSRIQYKETTHAAYAPTRIAIGTGYYAAHQLYIRPTLEEQCILPDEGHGGCRSRQDSYRRLTGSFR